MPLRTSGCIPRPKTLDNVCTCYKTVVKPLVHNHIISVPSVQRIIQTTATPVIEKIHYEATPVVDTPFGTVPASGNGVFVGGYGVPRFTPMVPVPSCAATPVIF